MIARRPLLRIAAPLIARGMLAAAGSDDPDDESVEGPTTSADESADEPVEPVDFSGRGPYAVGTVDLQVGSEHTIAVFYPVDPADVAADAEPYSYDGEDVLDPAIAALLPAALSGEVAPEDTWVGQPASPDGPFPTVLHSHGFSGNLRFANQHNAAVASWGYVVAAVDHPERGLEAILEQFLSPDQADASNDEYLDSDQLIAALDLLDAAAADAGSPRSEERRVGNECVSTGRSRWSASA